MSNLRWFVTVAPIDFTYESSISWERLYSVAAENTDLYAW